MAKNLRTAIAETVIRDRFEGKVERILLPHEIMDRSVVKISAMSPLTVLDFRDAAPIRLGISTDARGSKSFDDSQPFSRALHDRFPEIDGILYPSRLLSSQCLVVYDRALDKLKHEGVMELVESDELQPALRDFGIGFDDGEGARRGKK